MLSENIYHDLIEDFSKDFPRIAAILKALGNEKRLETLLLLLKGPQSYGTIVDELGLKKTAVSNHLSHLIKVNLIKRGDYGIYIISGDGVEFLRAIENAFQESPSRQAEQFEALERRNLSTSFLNRFNF